MMNVLDISATLPPGLQREFELAVERTGWTPALEHAARMLPAVLKMTPEGFERFSGPTYQRTI